MACLFHHHHQFQCYNEIIQPVRKNIVSTCIYQNFNSWYCRHLDGNHKLIRWRFVLHGGIDGFSRTIVYLSCSDNNRADTVHDLFIQATHRFHCPRRIRSDHGTENVAVARWLLNRHGINATPVITGLSVHNQRIERLWKDVNCYVVAVYRNIFYYLESVGLLDPVNDLHLLALHLVYKPRINKAIRLFTEQWNNHPLSTEQNSSPYQLWVEGFYNQALSGHSSVEELFNEDPENYGIDDEGPTPEIETQNNVIVPPINIHLSDPEMQILQLMCNPHEQDDDHGIQKYIVACGVIENLLSERE